MPAPVAMRTSLPRPLRFHQQRRGAARSVAGNLTAAAVGIPQFDAAGSPLSRWQSASIRRRPRRCGDRRSPRASAAGSPACIGQLVTPGEQEIVARSVRFCKRDLHLFAMVDIYVNLSHRRSFHHNPPPQDIVRPSEARYPPRRPKTPIPTRPIPSSAAEDPDEPWQRPTLRRCLHASLRAVECRPRAEPRSGRRTKK